MFLSNNNRYVITGIGLNDSLGLNPKESFFNMLESYNQTKDNIIINNKQMSCLLEKKNISNDIDGYSAKNIRRLTECNINIMRVVEHAIKDSNINFNNDKNVPVIFSVTTKVLALQYLEYIKNNSKINPYISLNFNPDFISSYIQARYNLHGHSSSQTAACSTGLYNLDYAIRLMDDEGYNSAIVGTSGVGCNPTDMSWFDDFGVMTTLGISRPFDKNRDGFMMGNGHSCIIIEKYKYAKARGAKIYAEIVGFGIANDGLNLTSPDNEMTGAKIALSKCLKTFNGDNIDYINAHATSTLIGDEIEARLMENNFPGTIINSNKGHIGHTIYSSNLSEIIYTIMSMKHSVIPHTLNLNDPLDANLDFVMHKPREKKIKYALKNAVGFGGRNGFILLKNMML